MTEKEKEERKLLERVSMFNDAVYAIALTLLVLELKLPEDKPCNTVAEMWHCIKEISPKLFAFLLSILLIGGNWISSVNIQRTHVRADVGYFIYSVIYLSLISLSPFLCYLIGHYPDNPLTYVVFGTVAEIINVNASLYIRHCLKKKIFHPDVDLREIKKLQMLMPVIGLFVAAIAASAFYSTRLSFGLFLLFNLLPFVATRSLKVNHREVDSP